MASKSELLPAPPEFKCRRCGGCCRIPGYVRITQEERLRIADYLKMTQECFLELCTIPTIDRPGALSLGENPDGSCLFLRPDNSCDIEPVKPRQCQTFPLEWSVPDRDQFCQAVKRGSGPRPRA